MSSFIIFLQYHLVVIGLADVLADAVWWVRG